MIISRKHNVIMLSMTRILDLHCTSNSVIMLSFIAILDLCPIDMDIRHPLLEKNRFKIHQSVIYLANKIYIIYLKHRKSCFSTN